MNGKVITFARSGDLDVPVRIKVDSLEGTFPLLSLSEQLVDPKKALAKHRVDATSDLTLTAQIYANSKPVTGQVSTTYKSFKSKRRWNEWLQFPLKLSQLSLDAEVRFELWDYDGSDMLVASAHMPFFDRKNAVLLRGRQKVDVSIDNRFDQQEAIEEPRTENGYSEMDRLEKLIKKHELGDMPRLDWLDNLAFRQIELVNAKHTTKTDLFLYVEYPQFQHVVVYSPPPVLLAPQPREQPQIQQIQNTQTDNPIESKYRRLLRSHKTGPLDKDLKPNAKMRDELNLIFNYPSAQELTENEKNLLWKFRYYATRDKRALTKFLKSVSWDDASEMRQAIALLPMWKEVDISDALEMLGPGFTDHPAVRSFAVDRLRASPDKELELYLLQLVQALQFDKDRVVSQFLISRAVASPVLGNYFYWYVHVQTQSEQTAGPFKEAISDFLLALQTSENGADKIVALKRESNFVGKLVKLAQDVRACKEARPKKVELLKSMIADPKLELRELPHPVILPLDPTQRIVGIDEHDCSVFKSSLTPLKLTFKMEDGSLYPIIFKSGDDLRQDQLVIQIITLMNQLLLNENLDLKITPYRILATGAVDGAIQFVPNQTLASVLSDYPGGILQFLKEKAPMTEEQQALLPPGSLSLGVRPEVMDTFVRSCAGYCVMTYILGVGDRHLDNLLISDDGHFFHADFGYILGRDPKPFPPLMKLPIQIIDGMGGIHSENYTKFRNYCFTAYTTLRKSANLILNLFSLMTEANIPDIAIEKDKAVQKVRDRFCLEMSDEEAIVHFQNLINDSVSAFLPMVIDRLHSLAQYWRA
ncbi:Phosphatidylinositol 3-kinase vps34 [Yarrowia sp. B02]|nr:Phosphatidylinositol 3-kinase vps34 [Yarrowia sp. B02]